LTRRAYVAFQNGTSLISTTIPRGRPLDCPLAVRMGRLSLTRTARSAERHQNSSRLPWQPGSPELQRLQSRISPRNRSCRVRMGSARKTNGRIGQCAWVFEKLLTLCLPGELSAWAYLAKPLIMLVEPDGSNRRPLQCHEALWARARPSSSSFTRSGPTHVVAGWLLDKTADQFDLAKPLIDWWAHKGSNLGPAD
jgi:hypothetical protein